MNKKISVIMGIYNCADTLREAIDSLLAQTYGEWELIMCDDGSSDNTYDVALQYSQKYKNIFLYRNEENKGLNYTLNKCLQYAKGDYIARMDGDDISLPERFEKEVDFLNSHDQYAIVSTPMKYFDEQGIFRVGKGRGEPKIENMAKGTPFCHAPCMVRAEAYAAVNGYIVSPKYLRVEDWQLWIKMYAKGYKGYVLEEPLYMMRDDQAAIKRRKFRYRINEARVSLLATKILKLKKRNIIFALRPVLVGILPARIYVKLHKRKISQ